MFVGICSGDHRAALLAAGGPRLKDVPTPTAEPVWAVVRVLADSLNMRDVWTLRTGRTLGRPAADYPRLRRRYLHRVPQS